MQELIVNIAPNLASKLPDFYKALGDTMLMVLWSGLISFVFGLLLGVVLTVTKPNGILENKVVYQILDKLVSLFRSIPFIILLTWVMPITRALVGTVLYVRGAIVPLVFGSVPFFTRQVESALAELDGGLIEAALSMGSSPLEIIFRVYLKESIAAIARGHDHHDRESLKPHGHGRRRRRGRSRRLRHPLRPRPQHGRHHERHRARPCAHRLRHRICRRTHRQKEHALT